MNTRLNDGGPAFPNEHNPHEGMSLRDWFAGMAISPMLVQAYGNTPDFLADHAYRIADAMLAARKQQ